MADVSLQMILRPYDQLCPLILRNVKTRGLQLSFDLESALTLVFPDGIDAGEISFNRYVLACARGDHELVGLPAFILRGFRHRNFFVRRDSRLESLSELTKLRLGTDSWPDSGTLWARAAMRDAGVEVGDVRWVVGKLDAATPLKPPRAGDAQPPRDAEFLSGTDTLMAALEEGRIDALTTAFAPDAVFRPDGAVRRLVRDYPEVEADYHRRRGVYPGFHIVAVRRSFAARHPQAVVELYDALRRSWSLWTDKAKKFAEASPWQMRELETVQRDFREDQPPFGMASASHRRMVATICHEQKAQGLVQTSADPSAVFADFERIAASVAGASEASSI